MTEKKYSQDYIDGYAAGIAAGIALFKGSNNQPFYPGVQQHPGLGEVQTVPLPHIIRNYPDNSNYPYQPINYPYTTSTGEMWANTVSQYNAPGKTKSEIEQTYLTGNKGER